MWISKSLFFNALRKWRTVHILSITFPSSPFLTASLNSRWCKDVGIWFCSHCHLDRMGSFLMLVTSCFAPAISVYQTLIKHSLKRCTCTYSCLYDNLGKSWPLLMFSNGCLSSFLEYVYQYELWQCTPLVAGSAFWTSLRILVAIFILAASSMDLSAVLVLQFIKAFLVPR